MKLDVGASKGKHRKISFCKRLRRKFTNGFQEEKLYKGGSGFDKERSDRQQRDPQRERGAGLYLARLA